MIGSLPLFHRVNGQRIVVAGEGDMAEARRRLVERAGGIPCGESEAHHARLAFVAVSNEREAQAIANRLRGKGLLVNVADRPGLCDFTMPSILDREPVLIAVSTSGASAGLAKQLRLRLEKLLPQSLGRLTRKLRDARETLRQRYPDADGRRHALDAALDEGGILDPLDPDAADRFGEWLATGNSRMQARQVAIELISENPDDLTIGQARMLGVADAIFAAVDTPPAILERARADAARHTWPHDGDWPDGLSVIVCRGKE